MRILPLVLALAACRASVPDPSEIDDDADGATADVDCNDADAAINPSAEELCNGVDDDCSGAIDDGASDASTFFADVDGDGYGDDARTTEACDPPAGHTTQGGDCDDGDADFHPGADESDCTDASDYNCDGSSGFADGDGDGFPACQDCDDTKSGTNPDADETCDGTDEDCDGQIDEAGATGQSTFYADKDGDGYGDAASAKQACAAPEGYVSDARDCNDSAAAAHPGGIETCDALDNDCDGKVDDDATDASTWYVDADADGHGSLSVSQKACSQPTGFTSSSDDCDDAKKAVYPGATETCDGLDGDCDGTIDEGFDADSDGVTSCGGDCDDTNAAIKPGAPETCDGKDNDCDGNKDEEAIDQKTWYIDYDGDGHGSDKFSQKSCTAPSGWVETKDDCDDLDPKRSPSAAEGCDGKDYDCDGKVDSDADGDTYPDISCGGTDCDDSNKDVKPEMGKGCALGTDCADILDRGVSTTDGVYTLDPDGYAKGKPPFDTYCDMTTEAGGWTLVGIWSNVDGRREKWLTKNSFTQHNDEIWFSGDPFGDCTKLGFADAKCGSYMSVEGGEMLIRERAWNGAIGVKAYTLNDTFTMQDIFKLPPYPSHTTAGNGTNIMDSAKLVKDPGGTPTAFVKNPLLIANHWLGNDGCRLASTTNSGQTMSGLGCRVDYTWPGWPFSETADNGSGDVNTDNNDAWSYADGNFGNPEHLQMVVWVYMR